MGHEVLAVVPQDRKRNIFGWVELAGKPIPVADLVKQSATVIAIPPKK